MLQLHNPFLYSMLDILLTAIWHLNQFTIVLTNLLHLVLFLDEEVLGTW